MNRKTALATAISAVLTLAGAAQAGQLALDQVPVPASDAEKRAILSSQEAQVNGQFELDFQGYITLLRSGDVLPLLGSNGSVSTTETIKYGTLFDTDGNPLMDAGEVVYSNSNDFNSLIQGADGRLYLISHFESRPGAVYQTLLNQEADGTLTPVATRPIDFSGVRGGWVHCAGSKTPWESHLGSEEYEPDAVQFLNSNTVGSYEAAMSLYFGGDGTSDSAKATMNPYDYGFPIEVKVGADGIATVEKRYAMGRSANELSYVMPDQKTAYITDDGTNTALYMFVADTAGDLSAGTLYIAKWVQREANAEGGKASIRWINLGHATDAEIAAALANKDANGVPTLAFDDLLDADFDETDPTNCESNGRTAINAGHGDGQFQCLKLADGADAKLVSRMELRRYGAMLGGTTEFRKMEGFTYNPERRTAYMAISEREYGMEDNAKNGTPNTKYDLGGDNDIRQPSNNCGTVYQMRVGGRVRDDQRQVIDSGYVIRTMEGLVSGTEVSGDPKNQCALDGIANPDNVTYLPKYNTLIIGEDTGSGHQNDVIWSYSFVDGSLTRVQTTPYGSETTSPYWYPDLNGFAYLMSVVQHPYGESDQAESTGEEDEKGYVGYFKFSTALD